MKRGGQFMVAAAIAGATLVSVGAQAQSACGDLDGTVGADRVCHARSSTATYTIDIGFPDDAPRTPAEKESP